MATAGLRVLIATNEPWGTYHVRPLLEEAKSRGWTLTQLVPDSSHLDPLDRVPVVTLEQAPAADLLVVNGAEAWPAQCARQLHDLPLAASMLAYLTPKEAPEASSLRSRLRAITASSAAEARCFRNYLATAEPITVVGAPQADTLPSRQTTRDRVVILTSVTYADETGNSSPSSALLMAITKKLATTGKNITVALHPREDPRLWSDYEISKDSSLSAAASAEFAVGIPGTLFPFVAAIGTPLIGCVLPGSGVPDYLLSICSAVVSDAEAFQFSPKHLRPPTPGNVLDAVGPIGGSASRLLDVWEQAAALR